MTSASWRQGTRLWGFATAFWLACGVASAAPVSIPPLAGRVIDAAKLLSAIQVRQLNGVLERYEHQTGHQFVVLTIPSLGDEPVEDFTLRAAEAYRLGRRQKKEDDGLLMVIAAKERRVRIDVGYGLEGQLPDVLCGRIIREHMAPALAAGQAAQAIASGLSELMKGAVDENAAPPDREANEGEMSPFTLLFLSLLGLFILWAVGPRALLPLLFMGNTNSRNESERFGGKGGRFGGGGASGGW